MEDLDKFKNHQYKWFANPNHAGYYVCCSVYLGNVEGKGFTNRRLYLHRYLLNCTDEHHIDHINNNTLDNRKSNLRMSDNKENTKHRKGKNTNNTSGYRNVSWIESYKKWCVQLIVNGKNTIIAKFDDVHEAGIFAKIKREELYGGFAGKG